MQKLRLCNYANQENFADLVHQQVPCQQILSFKVKFKAFGNNRLTLRASLRFIVKFVIMSLLALKKIHTVVLVLLTSLHGLKLCYPDSQIPHQISYHSHYCEIILKQPFRKLKVFKFRVLRSYRVYRSCDPGECTQTISGDCEMDHSTGKNGHKVFQLTNEPNACMQHRTIRVCVTTFQQQFHRIRTKFNELNCEELECKWVNYSSVIISRRKRIRSHLFFYGHLTNKKM